MLILEDPGGQPLDRLLGQPMELTPFLRLAVGLVGALSKLHQRGLIHKDIKPANIFVNSATGAIWLTGFGIATRLPRERQSPEPPEVIAGTLAYMAPEQTGRMNRSIDSRSDLYSLGVTFYEMLTGVLPFQADDPMEWVHCHVARTPPLLSERLERIPEPISAIVSKLLAKIAEERYQTAAGLDVDLRKCLAEWESLERIEPFPPDALDISDRLLIPEKLYGRDAEREILLGAFDRVVASTIPGTGACVRLLWHWQVLRRERLTQGTPRTAWPLRGRQVRPVQAEYPVRHHCPSLPEHCPPASRPERAGARPLARGSEGGAGPERSADGQPGSRTGAGDRKTAARPGPAAPRGAEPLSDGFPAFFLAVFARKEHPLVLFFDDLQWLDSATLDLLEHLITHSEVRHLLLVGAYRDNEVGAAHPLLQTLESIRKAGARVQEIVLAPLGLNDLGRLVADTLHCEPEHARSLAQLVQEKTGGNPFFAIQFFTALAEEGLLVFDLSAPGWQWDINRIRAKNYTDNVVDLMAGKLKRFSATTQEALKQLACLGNVAEIATLNAVLGQTEEAMHAAIWEAVHAGLVIREDSSYKFLHDRIQQAAYSLIAEEYRTEVHLRIGRVLLANMTAEELAEHLFDVANQFDRGTAGIVAQDEKAQVATIDLRAGRKAKATAAYASARGYFAAGMAQLDETDWGSQYELMFSLWLERAECEFLTSDFDQAEQLIGELSQRGASKVDRAAAHQMEVQLREVNGEYPEAVDSALACLNLFGIGIPAHPTWEHVEAEYETVWRNLDGRAIESLIDLPLMTDPETRAAMNMLSALLQPAYFTDFHLFRLVVCRMVNVSMRHGMCGASARGCGAFGLILGPVFHRYREGYRFAKLACDLVAKHGFIAYQAKVYLSMGVVALWTQPIATAIALQRAAFRTATETGDLRPTLATAWTNP